MSERPGLDEVLAGYLEEADRGVAPDRQAMLAEHPDLAGELGEFFENVDRLRALTEKIPVAPGARPPEAHPPARLRYFGDYELLTEIARGGMGVVYRARQISLDREVAVKMILPGRLACEEDVRRFHAEAEAAAALDHPGIVPIYEVGLQEQQHYFSMKLVPGGDLYGALERLLVDRREAARLLAATARAVHYAHQRGVLHRDLKPTNILLTREGQPMIADFGLAKRLDAEGAALTATGEVLGTPTYMAPEQAAGKTGEISTATDVYSLGVILYTLLVGEPPFVEGSPLEILQAVINTDPEPPRRRSGDAPRDLETICLRCLEKQPERRYDSALALAEELERWLEGRPILARPVGLLERAGKWVRRRPALAGLIALAILSLVGGVAGLLYHSREQARAARVARLAATRARQARQAAETAQTRAVTSERLATRRAGQMRRSLYRAQLNHAQREWEAGRHEVAYELLADTPAEERRFEWRYLQGRRQKPQWTRPLAKVPPAVTPDGRWLVGANGKQLLMLDLSSRKIARSWQTPTEPTSVAVSPDGKLLAIGSKAGVRLLSLPDGKLLRELPASRIGVPGGLAFRPGGALLAIGELSGGVGLVHDPLGEARVTRRSDAAARISDAESHRLCFSPDGKLLAAGRVMLLSGDLRIWRVADMTRLLHVEEQRVYDLAFSPDGETLAAADREAELSLWRRASLGWRRTGLRAHRARLQAVAWSPRGDRLATGAADGTVKLWDPGTSRVLQTLFADPEEVTGLAFRHGKPQLLSVGTKAGLRCWSTDDPVRRAREVRFLQPPVAVALSPDGKTAAVGLTLGAVTLVDLNSGKRTLLAANQTEFTDTRRVIFMAWSGDGRHMALTRLNVDGELKSLIEIWDMARRKLAASMPLARMVNNLTLSPDGRLLATSTWGLGGESSVLRLFDTTGKPLWERDNCLAYSLSFSRNSRELLAIGAGQVLRLDASTGRMLDERTAPESADVVALLPDGKIRAARSGWPTNPQERMLAAMTILIKKVRPYPSAYLVTPDGERLLTGHWDGSLRIRDAIDSRVLLSIPAHAGELTDVAVSADGRTIVTVGADKALRVWRADSR